MKTQKFISGYNPEDFKHEVQKYLNGGYIIVPTTLIAEPGGKDLNKWFCCVVEKEVN